MSEIVERLRDHAHYAGGGGICEEAADHIQSLESENKRLTLRVECLLSDAETARAEDREACQRLTRELNEARASQAPLTGVVPVSHEHHLATLEEIGRLSERVAVLGKALRDCSSPYTIDEWTFGSDEPWEARLSERFERLVREFNRRQQVAGAALQDTGGDK